MRIYDYEAAFGAGDKTSRAMRDAIDGWFRLYYDTDATTRSDPCQRVAYTVVNKLVKTVFGEYKASSDSPFGAALLHRIEPLARSTVQLALIGGECYLKPCPETDGFSFTLISRQDVLIFARDSAGMPTDMGTVERSTHGKYYYTLLERRTLDGQGRLQIANQLYRSLTGQSLGIRVPLNSHPEYAALEESYCYETPIGSVGLVQVKTPMLNCVDGSSDGVSVYAAAAGLIRNIDRNEAQLGGEFDRGESRIIASADLLRGQEGLQDHLFVGLDDDPEQVGITVFSPPLREQSYLARKQEYLRNVESIIGLKRGMLSDANTEDRTATEIAASAGDYSLTVIDFQTMWEQALRKIAALCCKLGQLYGLCREKEVPAIQVDWGNGVLYDEDKAWESYRLMVREGLLRPEVALGWRFGMPAETEEQMAAIRKKLMPEKRAE